MATQMERRAHERAAAIVARIPRAEAAGEMAAEMESHVAAFERISERSHGEIVAGLQRSLARWTRFLVTGTMPPDRSFDPLREWARARAAEGVRLEDLLRSFALAHQLGWQLLRRHARSDESDVLLELAGLVAEYHDQVSAVVTETYLGEREMLLSEVERGARSLLERLPEEEPLSTSERELAERLGVPLEGEYRPFVIVTPGRLRHRRAALAARLRADYKALAVTEGDSIAGLTWQQLDLADLGVGADVLLTIGERVPRAELARAQADVAALAEYARKLGICGRLDAREHALEVMIESSPRLTASIRDQVLTPLSSDDHAELVQTLGELVRCRFDRTAASAALHVHRNTLSYRLRRIEGLTGLDLGSPRDLACVYVALSSANGA